MEIFENRSTDREKIIFLLHTRVLVGPLESSETSPNLSFLYQQLKVLKLNIIYICMFQAFSWACPPAALTTSSTNATPGDAFTLTCLPSALGTGESPTCSAITCTQTLTRMWRPQASKLRCIWGHFQLIAWVFQARKEFLKKVSGYFKKYAGNKLYSFLALIVGF